MEQHVRWDSQNSPSLCLTQVAIVAKACHSLLTSRLLMCLLLFPHSLPLPLTINPVILFCPLFKTLSLPVEIIGMTNYLLPSLVALDIFFTLNYAAQSCGSSRSHFFGALSVLHAWIHIFVQPVHSPLCAHLCNLHRRCNITAVLLLFSHCVVLGGGYLYFCNGSYSTARRKCLKIKSTFPSAKCSVHFRFIPFCNHKLFMYFIGIYWDKTERRGQMILTFPQSVAYTCRVKAVRGGLHSENVLQLKTG